MAGTLIVSAALFAFSYYGVLGLIEQRAASNWPKAQARVTQSETYFSRKSLDRRLRLRYVFEAHGKEFDGARRYAIPPLIRILRPKARQFVSDHPVGSQIQIAYNPQDPARSLVSPGLGAGTWAPVALWLGLLGYCSACMWTELLRRWSRGVDGEAIA